jgi:hypothetical protein
MLIARSLVRVALEAGGFVSTPPKFAPSLSKCKTVPFDKLRALRGYHMHSTGILTQRELRNLLVVELFDSLVDDESLVGQQETAVAAPVARHCELHNAYPGLLATLVVPDRWLTRIARLVPPNAGVSLSVVTSAGAGGLLGLTRHDAAGIDIASVEPTLRDLDDLAGSAARVISAAGELGPEIAVFIELPYASGWQSAVELIEAAGLCGKISVGQAEPRQVVEQLSILIEADLPFKITSRHEENWLVLLAAVDALVAGASLEEATDLVRFGDHDQVRTVVASWNQATQSRVRRRVRRIGTASVRDVITDLAAYGEPLES